MSVDERPPSGDLSIFGVDPGLSLGLFGIKVPSVPLGATHLPLTRLVTYQGDATVGINTLKRELFAALMRGDELVVACERFTVMPNAGRMTQQTLPLELIGQVEALAAKYETKFILQSPGDAKKFCSNTQLRQFNLWTSGKDVGHKDANDVNDAARHVIFALAKTRATAFDALLRSSIPTQRS